MHDSMLPSSHSHTHVLCTQVCMACRNRLVLSGHASHMHEESVDIYPYHVDDGEEDEAQVGLAVCDAAAVQRCAQEQRRNDCRHHGHLLRQCSSNVTRSAWQLACTACIYCQCPQKLALILILHAQFHITQASQG